jgi:hypothetical protein
MLPISPCPVCGYITDAATIMNPYELDVLPKEFHLISIRNIMEDEELVIHLAGTDAILEIRLDEEKMRKLFEVIVDGLAASRMTKKRRRKQDKEKREYNDKLNPPTIPQSILERPG